MRQNLVIRPVQRRSSNSTVSPVVSPDIPFVSDDMEPSPQLSQRSSSMRNSQDTDSSECPTLRFKMISKHPDFPHNKLFSVAMDETLEQLQQKISKLTQIKVKDFSLFWEDADKYRFALNSSGDWNEALSYFSENKSTMNLKIYVTGVTTDPPWHTVGGQKARNFSFSQGSVHMTEHSPFCHDVSNGDDVISPTSFSHIQSAPADAHGPMDENIADGCDSFVTSSTATLVFNEDGNTLPESLSAHIHQQYQSLGLGVQQSFNQNLSNLSFCTVVEKNPSSPLCGPADVNTGQRMLWRRGRVLGKGAYGTVYLGLNQSSGELLAVKQVCIDEEQSMPTQETYARLRALAQEIRMMENLQHPNIVRYLGTDRTENGINIFMEYIPGGSIASLLKQFGPFQEKLISAYLKQILQGLNYLHGQHVLHRDIKGGNILVSQKGEIKLADFGSSKSLQDIVQSTSIKNTFVGTAEWMAPEAITCKNQTKPADIWSLGCTILEMSYADTPWSRTMQERRNGIAALYFIASSNERPKIPHEILSEEACDFINHCLQRDPNLRPTTSELLQHPWLQITSPVPSTPGTPLSPSHAVSMQTRMYQEGLAREGSPTSPYLKSGESEAASGESEDDKGSVEDQEQKILSYVAGEVQRTLSMAELPTVGLDLNSKVHFKKKKKKRQRPIMTIQNPALIQRLESQDNPPLLRVGVEPGVEVTNASLSSSSSPRRSPCSPLVNASFNSICSAGITPEIRAMARCRRSRGQSQASRLSETLERSTFETRYPLQKGLPTVEHDDLHAKPLSLGLLRNERTMLLVLIVVLISVVLAAFAQGFCRSLVAEMKLKASDISTPMLCLPIYNVAPPFDYFVLFICYVCIGISAVALQSALSFSS